MKKSGQLYFFFILMVTGSWFYSCVKDPYQDQVNQEKNQLAEYVSKHKITETPKPSGLYVIINPQDTGTGVTPLSTKYVLVNYSASFLDGTLYDTTDTTEVKKLIGHIPWFKPGGPVILSMSSVVFPGMMEGLSLIHEGGSATLLMPSSLAGNSFNPTPRIFYIQLLKVYDSIPSTQKVFFSMEMSHLKGTVPDSLGNFYIDTTRLLGVGNNFPVDTDRVAIKYTLQIKNDYLFEKSSWRVAQVTDSFKFPMDTVPSLVFYHALLKMKRKGKATIYFPNGAGSLYDNETGQLLVPPYCFIRYDIEFLGFLNKKGIIDTIRYK